jgi:integrase
MTKFTDTFIKSLKPEAAKYYKREANGFAVKVWPSGVKTWVYIYTADGKRRELKMGEYPSMSLADARTAYGKAYALHQAGTDPGAVESERRLERKRTPTVAEFIEEYVEKHAKVKKRSWRNDKEALEKDILPAWGSMKITDIKRRDLLPILDGIVDRGSPIQANRLLAYVRKMFSYAVERLVIEINPFLRMKPLSEENSRERFLSAKEIKTFWDNLSTTNTPPELQRALKLILVTAQRPGEVIEMHRQEITDRWWTIPKERAKNKRTHRVYLTDLALDLIGDAEGYIFESPRNPGHPYDSQVATKSLKRNINAPLTDDKGKPLFTAEGKPAVKNILGVADFTPHDLRRTAATLMAEAKILREHRERVLNHALEKLDATYNQHDYDDAKQAALETLERKLQAIITGTGKDNVVSITRRKAA